jgi:predicted molibdopterin-dependent oxidoreductase YjgC
MAVSGPRAGVKRLDGARQPVALTVDGEVISAFRGETVLTALLAARGWIPPFEFGFEHRAGFCLIGACQDCWVRLADGTPIRACTTFVADAMDIVTDERR